MATRQEAANVKGRVVFWVAWGEQAVAEVGRSFASIRDHLDATYFLVTSDAHISYEGLEVLRYDFATEGFFRKAEVFDLNLFVGASEVLFLDSDTVVLSSVEFGFEKARKFGIAIAPAPTYLLDEYRDTSSVLRAEGIQRAGQLLLNSGVVFFKPSAQVQEVFRLWLALCEKYSHALKGDQEALTIAMEVLDFNPYILSKSYNLRGIFEPVIGTTRIWHARQAPPENLNVYQAPYPPRLLAKFRLRDIRRKETHNDSMRYFLVRKILNPLYRKFMPLIRRIRQIEDDSKAGNP